MATLDSQSPPKKIAKNDIWSPVLRRGQMLPYRVLVFRKDGYNGEISLKAEGLPPFVTCPAQLACLLVPIPLCSSSRLPQKQWIGPDLSGLLAGVVVEGKGTGDGSAGRHAGLAGLR